MSSTVAAMLGDVPQGYAQAVATLCQFPADILAELCCEVLDFISYKCGAVDLPHARKRLLNAGLVLAERETQTAINALVFTLRQAVRTQISAAELAAELKSAGASVWTGKAVKIVKLAWSERREAALADAQSAFSRLLNIGQLVDFQWKIGLAVASGDVSRLGRPYVAVEFKIADTEGAVQHTNLELSLSDFQLLSERLKEMSAAMETV